VRRVQAERTHLGVVRWLLRLETAPKPPARGPQPRRALERAVRCRVVKLGRELEAGGRSLRDVAGRLGLPHPTLLAWRQLLHDHRLRAQRRGRPQVPVALPQRAEVRQSLEWLGPDVSLASLQAIHPGVPRAVLHDLLSGYRRDFQDEHPTYIHALTWTRAGTVWAMDYTETPAPIDGRFPWTLVVRDLASGLNLLWLPVLHADADTTRAALRALFVHLGAPLVLKSDNGSHFINDEVLPLLGQWGVLHLRSPIRAPWYNGSCEAGIGALKTYVHHQAAANDRPQAWSCDDVEAARLTANAQSRPEGRHGPSAEQLWQTRKPITRADRTALCDLVASRLERLLTEAETENPLPLDEHDRIKIERQAIAWALAEAGLLLVRRRRIRPPLRGRKWS
jgi:transposase InsO family protein